VELLERTQLLAYHRGMLADVERVDRYREAILAVVREGDVVVDVGAGTGLLSYFACQAGARRVFAIEAGPIVAVARELARANGFADRVEFIAAHSSRAVLPEPADVLVTETLWNFGIGEGVLGFIRDARQRFLRPGARVVPSGVDLYLAPLQVDDFHARLADGPPDRHGLDFAPMRPYAVNQVQVPRVHPDAFLAEPALLTSVDLTRDDAPEVGGRAQFSVARDGVLHGFAGWFDAELADGIRLGNAPPAEGSSWAHVLFPLERGLPVRQGDEVSVRIETVGNGTTWRWVTETDGARFDQTTFFGFPFDPFAHGRRALSAQPVKSREGELVAYILQALDGTRTLESLAAEVHARFPDAAGDESTALDLVRDVAERYGA
jgi:predicted RNA methylase